MLQSLTGFFPSNSEARPAAINRDGLLYAWNTNAPKQSVIQLGDIVLRGGLGHHAKSAHNASPVFPGHVEYPKAIIGPAYGRENQDVMRGIYTLQA